MQVLKVYEGLTYGTNMYKASWRTWSFILYEAILENHTSMLVYYCMYKILASLKYEYK